MTVNALCLIFIDTIITPQIETLVLTLSLLIILSVILSKWSNNTGFPYLLLFLIVGMIGGSEGIGGIHFNNPEIAKQIGVACLVFILFSGGLDTKWTKVKDSAFPAFTLATFGVLATALCLGGFIYLVLDINFMTSLLLASVVASTDAAAVFSILGGKNLALKPKLKYLLELESGSNDPMAIFLTISFIQVINLQLTSIWSLILMFFMQMGLGFISGIISGSALVWLINKIKFPIEGFYPVLILSCVFFIYSGTTILNGSGFLAVYVAGIVVSNREIVYKRNISRYFDGFAWLSQIVMFVTLGLLVFPSSLIEIVPYGILVSLFLIFVARPIGVYLSLLPFKYSIKEQSFISWVGLRGAAPIILATFPLLAGIPEAYTIFNIVFFIVLTSALLQGWTIPLVAKKLNLLTDSARRINSRLEIIEGDEGDMTILDVVVPEDPKLLNKPLVELPELKNSLIVLVCRNGSYFVPTGSTSLEAGDHLQILSDKKNKNALHSVFET